MSSVLLRHNIWCFTVHRDAVDFYTFLWISYRRSIKVCRVRLGGHILVFLLTFISVFHEGRMTKFDRYENKSVILQKRFDLKIPVYWSPFTLIQFKTAWFLVTFWIVTCFQRLNIIIFFFFILGRLKTMFVEINTFKGKVYPKSAKEEKIH